MRPASGFPAALAGLLAVTVATAQAPPGKAIADYKSYSVALEKPQTVLVFAFWSTGALALIRAPDSARSVLPAGVSSFPILREGRWIAGGLPKPFAVSNGPASLSCSPQQGLLNTVEQTASRDRLLTRWCIEMSSGMRTVVEGMPRPNHLLVLGTDPIAIPISIEKALAGFKLQGQAVAVAADLAAALERAIPGSSWWSAVTR